ncbi:Ig-like domain-containing protein [Corallibacter sp.]|uniref:Ig-like domain-containing protein n=1 Tax=Corallibacter sp. TaxID=2038084 RepID=UPI003A8D6A11
MKKTLLNFFGFCLISMLIINCANRGNPSGGPRDTTPPEITKSEPKNYSTNFNNNEIKIYFDEYIKIKDIQRQLIISPPMDPKPVITPLGGASKRITIKILDTLSPNTTYAFNFGNSIVDNNEENPYPYFRYVFSTGSTLDSLTVKGTIIDAELRKPDNFVSVMLYEVDSTFNDSVVYNKLPRYITNTLDSTTVFSVENMKPGKYMMVAINDKNQDNKFQPQSDKIGFSDTFIDVPTDSTAFFTLKLFNEELTPKIIRPRLLSGEKIGFGFQGNYNDMSINILSEVPDDYEYRITKDQKTDTLNYWYKPRLENTDSLIFNVSNKKGYSEDFTIRISEQKRDTLALKAEPTGTIKFYETFKIYASTPLSKIDEEKIKILDKDSLNIAFSATLDSLENSYAIHFEKSEENKYAIQILPEAFTDFFNDTNDSLNFSLNTKSYSDYGNARVTLQNAVYPVIVQFVDEKGEVKYEKFSEKAEPLDFRNMESGDYFLRVIYDSNKNKKFDTGNYLEKRQPERISYAKEIVEIRAFWDQVVDFTLE